MCVRVRGCARARKYLHRCVKQVCICMQRSVRSMAVYLHGGVNRYVYVYANGYKECVSIYTSVYTLSRSGLSGLC